MVIVGNLGEVDEMYDVVELIDVVVVMFVVG
jgi:hypothetical protein